MAELCDLSAVALRRLIGAKQISPVELLASCRARTNRINGALKAFVATCLDRAEDEVGPFHAGVRAAHGLNVEEFQRFCDRIGEQAKTRGLTEEKLAEILTSDP